MSLYRAHNPYRTNIPYTGGTTNTATPGSINPLPATRATINPRHHDNATINPRTTTRPTIRPRTGA